MWHYCAFAAPNPQGDAVIHLFAILIAVIYAFNVISISVIFLIRAAVFDDHVVIIRVILVCDLEFAFFYIKIKGTRIIISPLRERSIWIISNHQPIIFIISRIFSVKIQTFAINKFVFIIVIVRFIR